MPSYQYRKYHCRDKTFVRSSYLHSGISYTGKMSTLNWIGTKILIFYIRILKQCGCKQNNWSILVSCKQVPDLDLFFIYKSCRKGLLLSNRLHQRFEFTNVYFTSAVVWSWIVNCQNKLKFPQALFYGLSPPRIQLIHLEGVFMVSRIRFRFGKCRLVYSSGLNSALNSWCIPEKKSTLGLVQN